MKQYKKPAKIKIESENNFDLRMSYEGPGIDEKSFHLKISKPELEKRLAEINLQFLEYIYDGIDDNPLSKYSEFLRDLFDEIPELLHTSLTRLSEDEFLWLQIKSQNIQLENDVLIEALRLDRPTIEQAENRLEAKNHKNYLALSDKILPARYKEFESSIPEIIVAGELSILVVTASPKDKPQIQNLDEKVNRMRIPNLAHHRINWLNNATIETLQTTLKNEGPFHMIYFICHGNEQGLFFENFERNSELVDSATLKSVIDESKNEIGLIVLNACHSAKDDHSIAQSLVDSGIPAVIGMRSAVSPFFAGYISEILGSAIESQVPLEYALATMRRQLFEFCIYEDNPHQYDWLAPIIYLRTETGEIFNVKKPKDSWIKVESFFDSISIISRGIEGSQKAFQVIRDLGLNAAALLDFCLSSHPSERVRGFVTHYFRIMYKENDLSVENQEKSEHLHPNDMMMKDIIVGSTKKHLGKHDTPLIRYQIANLLKQFGTSNSLEYLSDISLVALKIQGVIESYLTDINKVVKKEQNLFDGFLVELSQRNKSSPPNLERDYLELISLITNLNSKVDSNTSVSQEDMTKLVELLSPSIKELNSRILDVNQKRNQVLDAIKFYEDLIENIVRSSNKLSELKNSIELLESKSIRAWDDENSIIDFEFTNIEGGS